MRSFSFLLEVLTWIGEKLFKVFRRKFKHSKEFLLIEDDRDLALLFILWCKRLGYHCDWQVTAEGGRALLEEKKYAIIFVDLKLPYEQGYNFIENVLNKYPDVQIVTVTGSTRYLEMLPSSKFFGLILKPVRED